MTEKEIDAQAEKLYEYGKLNQTLQPADAIIALGNMDLRIADRAADLWHAGLAPIIVTSGGIGRLTPKDWATSEAAKFAERAVQRNVPIDKVIIEDRSTNIPENIRLSLDALASTGLPASRIIIVTLPFAEKRIIALCQKQFPEIQAEITSPDVRYEEFFNKFINRCEAINMIVGEIDRLEKFPAKGFIVEQEIPKEILHAYHLLAEAGFNKYCIE